MFHNYQSHSLKDLAKKFATEFKPDEDDPFSPSWVIVQNNEVKEWLSLKLADHHNIAANLRFIFPSEFLWVLYRLKVDEVPKTLPGDLNAIHWKLFSLFTEKPALLKKIPFYDLDNDSLSKRFQLSAQLADNFDLYQVYRPGMMEGWLDQKLVTKHKDEIWQAGIWKALNKEWKSSKLLKDIPRRSKANSDLIKWLKNGDRELISHIPKRVYAFGLSHLSKPFLEIIAELSASREVFFFHRLDGETSNAAGYDALISKWSESAQLQISLLQDILNGNGIENKQHKISEEGQSQPHLKVHSCHNKRREVQVLKDEILRFLEENPETGLNDILIMLPDAEEYVGLLEIVFENDQQEPALPIANFSRWNNASLEHTLIELLNLLDSSFKVSSILQFIQLEPVKECFDFDEDHINLIEKWVSDNNVHWGLGEESSQEYSWQKGLNQLLSGFSMQTKPLKVYEHMVPYDESFSSDDAQLLSRLSHFLYLLKNAATECRKAKSPTEWIHFIEKLVEDFISGNDQALHMLMGIKSKLERLREQLVYAEPVQGIEFNLIKPWLCGQLETNDSTSGRYGQGIIVSSYIPYRAIPFDFIAMLGMNESVFPRKAVRPIFDIIHAEPEAGDRILKEDDTFLFVETLQAAKKHLHLSFLGQDQRADFKKLPSMLIQQLLDTEETLEVIEHSLHPFNAKYYLDKNQLSFSGSNQKIAEMVQNYASDQAHGLLDTELNIEPGESEEFHTINDLINFFTNPCKQFVQNKLGAKHFSEFMVLEDREAFQLKGLEKYKVDDLLFQYLSKEGDAAEVYNYVRAASMIPDGLQGDKAFSEEQESIHELLVELHSITHEAEQKVELSVNSGERQIEGVIKGIYGKRLINYRVGSRRAPHEISLWLKHLLLLSAGIDITESIYLSKEKEGIESFVIHSENINENPLQEYLGWFLREQDYIKKVAFFPASSKAYAESYLNNQDHDKAISAASRQWVDSGYNSFYAESNDLYNDLIWRAKEPLHYTAFHENALTFWTPFYSALNEEEDE